MKLFKVVISVIVSFFIIAVVILMAGLRFDYAEGGHKIKPTAVDSDFWGNYKVYYKTSEYTQNSQENYYWIDKNAPEMAEKIKEYIRANKEIIVHYDKYVGYKGISAPAESPIIRIELVEESEED